MTHPSPKPSKAKKIKISKSAGGVWLFYPPYFKFLGKPKAIAFHSVRAFNKFLDSLPKNWREKMRAKD